MFTEQEIHEIQDQLRAHAVRKGERAEEVALEHTRILLFRCTMCCVIQREFIPPEDARDPEVIIRDAFANPRIHPCQETAGEHRKYGVQIPIGVLSKW